MNRPRLLAVHPNVEMYGSDRMFLAGVERLAHDFETIVVLPEEGALADALRSASLDLRVLNFPVLRKVEMSGRRAPAFAAKMARAALSLARWLQQEQIDIVYVSTVIAPVWVLAARRAGCRIVCHVHENEPGMSSTKRRVLLGPLRLCDTIVANSASTRQWIESAVSNVPVTVIYNGVEEPARMWPATLGTAEKHLVVVGRLSERKGQDVALEAMVRLRNLGFDVDLTFVGDVYPGYEGYETQLRLVAAATGVADRVNFAGFRPNPADYMAAADVVLVPSRVEPFGNVAVEAQLLGRPVVASDVQGLAEIIEHDDTGLLVPPGDPQALAFAVSAVLTHASGSEAMGQLARDEAEKRFGLDQYGAAIVAAVRA